MTEALTPCPFCGGKASMESGRYQMDDGMYAFAHVECLSCGACGSGFTEAEKPVESVEALAADAWNRRAERTPRVEEDTKRASQTQLVVTKSYSECGHCFGAETHYERMFEGMVLNEIELPSYCPACGAKVVEEES